MKTFKDAAMLLVLLLLVASVKIAPVDGPSNVVPLTHAGVASQQATTDSSSDLDTKAPVELPVIDARFATRMIEMKIDEADECTSMVIVIDTDRADGEPLVLRLAPDPAPEPVPAPRPAVRPQREALTACNRG